jgi:hypothetical protein
MVGEDVKPYLFGLGMTKDVHACIQVFMGVHDIQGMHFCFNSYLAVTPLEGACTKVRFSHKTTACQWSNSFLQCKCRDKCEMKDNSLHEKNLCTKALNGLDIMVQAKMPLSK